MKCTLGALYLVLGLDARTFTDPIERLDFSWQSPSVIDVRLIATVEDDPLSCLTEAERVDTSRQTLELIEWPDDVSIPIYGKYLGSSAEYADSTYTIRIEWDETGTTLSAPYLYNMQRDCPEKQSRIKIFHGFDYFVTNQERSRDRCQNFLAIGKLNDDDHREIKIDYWYDDAQGQRRHYVFTGWRQ